MSMNEAKDKKISLEPLNPEQRVRKSGIPVGLKNIGNSKFMFIKLATSIHCFKLIFKMPISPRQFLVMRSLKSTKVLKMIKSKNTSNKILTSKES